MPRKRNPENKGLPARWRHVHGAYYYQVPPGLESLWDNKKTFRLGTTLPEAYKAWADRIGSIEKTTTIGQLFDRYALEVIPKKKSATQRADDLRAITNFRPIFGNMAPGDVEPYMIYKYVDKRTAKVAARREVATLSHVLTKAVEWGVIKKHPFKGEVRLEGEAPRTRYVEDWELIEALSVVPRRKKGSVFAIQAYIRMKLLSGMRRGDMLRLTMSDLREDGIHVAPRKTETTTGKKLIIEWSEELREAVEMAKIARPVSLSPYLFCNKEGECYFDEKKDTASGWDSMWQRFMERVLKETKVTERFTEHDLRAKCASDAETLEHARALLAHADSRTTDRIYRRKAERVKPLR